eukprot:CAMPEP_0181032956 /NCGR_PEP_ID=MMETSP1070-20121207/7003_1 /TAXON_ID=265543 /ORGANISM="Minutocellus polymorphus, Strain NH13" /LENGTH=386 /DNA_ID=CAMNT_0023110357 /DNA_START=313 /DNA_END=1473 /DNA_ORIENTATION=-
MKTKRTNRSSPNYETFLSGSHNVVRNSEESNQQQVIILAGPHKTASSSIQYNLMRWFGDTNDTLGLQKRWSFDSPIKIFQEEGCVSALRYPYQVFYWLVQAILENPTKCRSNELTGEIIYTREEMLELYTRRFRESWSRGKSIIIATEAIDTANSIQYAGTSNELLLKLLQLLPSSSTGYGSRRFYEKTTAVIMYRSPRIQQLQSMWFQHTKDKRNQNLTFSQYLGKIRSNLNMLNPLDSFNLAKQFLILGAQVILIDMSGIKAAQEDISCVVGCKILEGHCRGNDCNATFTRLNAANYSGRDRKMDVSNENLIKINEAIKLYDCQHYPWLNDNKDLIIMYPFDLQSHLSWCQEQPQQRMMYLSNLTTEEARRVLVLAIDKIITSD